MVYADTGSIHNKYAELVASADNQKALLVTVTKIGLSKGDRILRVVLEKLTS